MRAVLALLLISSVLLAGVLVSVKPLQLIVEEIYPGDVEVLIDPDQNPHMFQLTPSAMRKVESSDILIVVGYGFEEWIKRLKGVRICVSGEGLGSEALENPHVWLDPIQVMKMAVRIERCLEEVYPDKGEVMRENLVKFLKELDRISEEFWRKLGKLDGTILELRPALWYFVRRYTRADYVTLVSQSQPSLSPRKLKEILDLCKSRKLKYIIVERNSSEKIAQPVIRGCALKILKVDVLGSDASSYEEMIQGVASIVEEALR